MKKTLSSFFVLSLLLGSLSPAPSHAQEENELISKVNRIFAEVDEALVRGTEVEVDGKVHKIERIEGIVDENDESGQSFNQLKLDEDTSFEADRFGIEFRA